VPAAAAAGRYDATRLRQVLDELVDNAVKFTLPGTRIRLEAAPVNESGREWVCIRVRDRRPWNSADQLPHLFDSFRQLDARDADGWRHGIGAALARQLIGAMDGRLTAESEMGRGTTFSLLPPAA